MKISLSQNASTISIVRPEFVSTTLDWWPLQTRAWGNASVINADLTHPDLIAAARGLSPYFLRIGGSQADSVIYNMTTSTSTVEDANRFAKACDQNRQLCLTMQRWEEVLKFAQDAGARIVFTLAYIRHTRDKSGQNDQQDWDSTNARQLLQYTAQSKYARTVFGFELGNEVTHKGKVENVTRLVNAYQELRNIIDETWSSNDISEHSKPLLLGPASTGQSITKRLLKALGKNVDIATYHKYHGGGKQKSLEKYAKSTSIIQHPQNFKDISSIINKEMSKPEVWVGEGAMAYNSGRRNTTDSFIGSFWFTNLLGAIAKSRPHTVYCRQALIGGHYELISHQTMEAMPDYWIAYLWKKLVGTKAIGQIISPHRKDKPQKHTFGCCEEPGYDKLLIHAFCAKGESSNPIFVVTNFDKGSSFNLNITVGSQITKYILTGKGGRRDSKSVVLNDKQLLQIENGQLPEIDGEHTDDLLLVLPPASIAFVIVHGFQVNVCAPPVAAAATELSAPVVYNSSVSLDDQHQVVRDDFLYGTSEREINYQVPYHQEVQRLMLGQVLAAAVFFTFLLCFGSRRMRRARKS